EGISNDADLLCAVPLTDAAVPNAQIQLVQRIIELQREKEHLLQIMQQQTTS
ncbi:hypothetical protein GGI26_004615, partial [Coemansia sp. RSA 1358]